MLETLATKGGYQIRELKKRGKGNDFGGNNSPLPITFFFCSIDQKDPYEIERLKQKQFEEILDYMSRVNEERLRRGYKEQITLRQAAINWFNEHLEEVIRGKKYAESNGLERGIGIIDSRKPQQQKACFIMPLFSGLYYELGEEVRKGLMRLIVPCLLQQTDAWKQYNNETEIVICFYDSSFNFDFHHSKQPSHSLFEEARADYAAAN